MKNNATAVYSLLLVVGDFLALLAAFVLAYAFRFKIFTDGAVPNISGRTFIYTILGMLPLWILIHAFIGLYTPAIYEKRFRELGRLLFGSFLGILALIGYDFMTGSAIFPGRLVPVYALLLGFSFLFVFRTLVRNLRRMLFKYGVGISNILIIGNTTAADTIARTISDTKHSGLFVLGIVGRSTPPFKYFSSFKDAMKSPDNLPHGIIQTELYKDQAKNNEILRFAQEHHISYRFVPGNSDLFIGNIDVELFADLPVIAVHQTSLVGWGRITKRVFDFFSSLLLITVAAPIMLLIVLGIKTFDPRGGVLFRQKRLTRFNRQFTCYKFRTVKKKYNGMTPEKAFEVMSQPNLAAEYRANGDFLPYDPRFSMIGRFLRRTSLDELPQLFNVLKGDLSLVGPRALIAQELDAYAKKHFILSVKAGVTGLAQISGRRDISFEERRKIDMYYVQNWNFWLDISILLRTLRVVLFGSGAK